MNQSGDQFLARPALPCDQDEGVGEMRDFNHLAQRADPGGALPGLVFFTSGDCTISSEPRRHFLRRIG
jgi:hypothetical protein